MNRYLIIFAFLPSCFSSREQPKPMVENIIQPGTEEALLESIQEIEQFGNPDTIKNNKRKYVKVGSKIEVNWRQWLCCWDTCGKRNNLQSLIKYSDSSFIDCLCKDGRLFQIRKKGRTKIGLQDPGEYESTIKGK